MIDTAKAANLYASHPADFLSYVNPPVGEGTPVPGPLKPHIACPTTSGTGSEVTGIAIFDLLSMSAKTGIASARAASDRSTRRPRLHRHAARRKWSPARGSTCCRTHWSRSLRGRLSAGPRPTGRVFGR